MNVKRVAEDYANMYELMEKVKTHLAGVNVSRGAASQLSKKKNDRQDLCGFDDGEWIKSLMDSAYYQIQNCVGTAMRCSVCCEIVPTRKELLLKTHVESTRINYSKPVPCMVCTSCFEQYVASKCKTGKPMLKCPGMGCGCDLDKDHIEKIAPGATSIWQTAMMKFTLKKCSNFKFCPNGKCNHGFSIYEKCAATSISCPRCNTSFCQHCNAPPHEKIGTCVDLVKKQHQDRWGKDKPFVENDCKQCPYCKVWIEKNGGCQHMTCENCRGEFCWKCFGQWRGHGSNCDRAKKVTREHFHEQFPTFILDDEKTTNEDYSSEESDFEEEHEKVMDEQYLEFLKGVNVVKPKPAEKKNQKDDSDDQDESSLWQAELAYREFITNNLFDDSSSDDDDDEPEEDWAYEISYNNFNIQFMQDSDTDESESEEESSSNAARALFTDDSSDESDSESST